MKQHRDVTANQIAHQLLLNGKPIVKPSRLRIPRVQKENDNFSAPFTVAELNSGIAEMQNGKAAGIDDMCTEQIKHFGNKMVQWLLELMNSCLATGVLPKSWRLAKVRALLKPEKNPKDPKSYRPISLLCHLFKLYERLILNRLAPFAEDFLIPEQAGIRGSKSCTNQILNLTQFIEDGYEKGLVTGAVFVDPSAAYDTVNHRSLPLLRETKNSYRDAAKSIPPLHNTREAMDMFKSAHLYEVLKKK